MTLWRVALLLLALMPAAASAREALLQEGTRSLYQRVLTRPAAVVVDRMGGTHQVEKPPPFTVYYVYARQMQGGQGWLEVGANAQGEAKGWIAAETAVDWKQALVLTFANPTGRLPTLFFDTKENLASLVENEALPTLAPQYVERTRAGSPPDGAGIVSIEPAEWIDFGQNFYLLPILDVEEVFLSSAMRKVKLVEIASIPLQEETPREELPFSAGIVFVIDTTTSMDPYIDRTRETVRRIFDRIKASPIGSQVGFGLIGFRDNSAAVEYAAKVFAPLAYPPNHEEFQRQIQNVQAARASTRGFNEDGLAGVVKALELDRWKHFQARYIIYIGDSGVREPPDPSASTGRTVQAVNSEARDKTTAIISLLLETPAGRAYHQVAQRQLRQLSAWQPGQPEPFYAVPQGDLARFGQTVDSVTDWLIGQVQAAASGQTPAPHQAAAGDQATNQLQGAIEQIGRAMRLAWLGRQPGAAAPDMFRAWAPEIALDNPVSGNAFDVRVLLTRTQVNQLYTSLKLIYDTASSSLDEDPGLFFERLQSVVARAVNDPSQLQSLDPSAAVHIEPGEVDNLGDLLDDYLQHLPFREGVIGPDLDRDAWVQMSPAERDQTLSSINQTLRFLESYYRDLDRWIPLHAEAAEGEKVYPIPLKFLP